MRIENEILLDFSDVLIRPKRSTLTSRKEVNLGRSYTFKYSQYTWYGIPIMAANMDGVGTIAMANVLSEFSMFTCLTKDIGPFELLDAKQKNISYNSYALSTGTSDADLFRIKESLKLHPEIQFICIDVANGYSEAFGNFVAKVRELYPNKTIIAGNVVTADMTQELILRGADIVKVGIGPGCFAPGQKVITNCGLKNIENIQKGEKVLTHTGSYKTVTNTFKFDDKKSIINVNGIKATPNHEFYVLHKKFKDEVTDENVHEYAEWISAHHLTKEYFLLRHK
jgi:guanosine monophosphate reductase